jgi:hypothetical protein
VCFLIHTNNHIFIVVHSEHAEPYQRDWLIFQLLPLIVIDGKHPFLDFVYSCLAGASLQTLLELLDATGPAAILGSAFDHDNFFYILDEAEVSAE